MIMWGAPPLNLSDIRTVKTEEIRQPHQADHKHLPTELAVSSVIQDVMTYIQDSVKTHSSTSGTIILNHNEANIHIITATGDITLQYQNLPTIGGFVIHAINWGGFEVTFPANTKFPEIDHELYPSSFTEIGKDVCIVTTLDGGTNTIFAIAQKNIVSGVDPR